MVVKKKERMLNRIPVTKKEIYDKKFTWCISYELKSKEQNENGQSSTQLAKLVTYVQKFSSSVNDLPTNVYL